MKTIADMLFGLTISSVVLYCFWSYFGPFGLVYGMPVLAICAMPLVDLVAGLPHLATRIALRRYEGRYYAFRGRHVDIDFDARGQCWISTADIRKIMPSLPADAVMQRLQPGLVKVTGNPSTWRITSEAAAAVLAKSTDADVAKFFFWLDGEVVSPARKRIERGMPVR